MNSTQNFKTTVDVRSIVPRERHPLIFGSFDALSAGEALLLVNDHDPKPLFYQFQAESKGEFTWDYLDQLGQRQAQLWDDYLQALSAARKSRDPNESAIKLML